MSNFHSFSEGKIALQKCIELRNSFLSENIDKIEEIDSESANIVGVDNGTRIYVIITMSYFEKANNEIN